MEFAMQGLNARSQVPIEVSYKGQIIGQYLVDIVVEKVALELKAKSVVLPMHEAQLLNYLKASGLQVGMLINFTYPKVTIKRLVVYSVADY